MTLDQFHEYANTCNFVQVTVRVGSREVSVTAEKSRALGFYLTIRRDEDVETFICSDIRATLREVGADFIKTVFGG